MPLSPKPQPPRSKRCSCLPCRSLRSPKASQEQFMALIAAVYNRKEIRLLIDTARASLLPKDPS